LLLSQQLFGALVQGKTGLIKCLKRETFRLMVGTGFVRFGLDGTEFRVDGPKFGVYSLVFIGTLTAEQTSDSNKRDCD
jgi:hypothetical protein